VLLGTEEVRADARAMPVEEGGCTGIRSAEWSADRHRVYLTSRMDCGEGVERSTRGVLSILPDGQGWVEIHAVSSGGDTPLLGIRSFLPASAASLERHGIGDPAQGMALAVSTARAQAGRALAPDALVEVVDRTGPEVASALLVERGDRLALDAGLLRNLSDRGVPGDVLDVLVAMSYPERFELAGSGQSVDPQLRTPAPAASAQRSTSATWPPRGTLSRRYSPWGLGYYDPFWSDPYFYGYSRYGYYQGGGFSRPIGSPYYSYPRVIVVQPPVVQDRGTRVDRDRGYVGGSASPSGAAPSTNATPTTRPAPAPAPADARSTPPPANSGGGNSGNDASPPPRRAVPRP